MKILKGSVDWKEGFMNRPTLRALVDHIPDTKELRYEAYTGDQREILYVAELDGYVDFLVEDPSALGGAICRKLQLIDGSIRDVNGCWSGNPAAVNELLGTEYMDIDLTDDPTFMACRYACHCTRALVESSAHLFDTGKKYGAKEPLWGLRNLNAPVVDLQGATMEIVKREEKWGTILEPAARLKGGTLFVK